MANFMKMMKQAADMQKNMAKAQEALAALVERAVERTGIEIEGEEVGQRDRDAVEHLLERTHRRTDLVLFDQRDGAVGDAHALGQLALAEAFGFADQLQACADVHHHPVRKAESVAGYFTPQGTPVNPGFSCDPRER